MKNYVESKLQSKVKNECKLSLKKESPSLLFSVQLNCEVGFYHRAKSVSKVKTYEETCTIFYDSAINFR